MDPGVRAVRLVILFFLTLALCTVPFGESGCVFVDTEKTGQIMFEAWRSECHAWTEREDFVNCTREDVDLNSWPGNVTLALNESGEPVEPTAVVGIGELNPWNGPGPTSYIMSDDSVPLSAPMDDDLRDASALPVPGPSDHHLSVKGDASNEGLPLASSEVITGGNAPPPIGTLENATSVDVLVGCNETGGPVAQDGSIAGGSDEDETLVSCLSSGEVPQVIPPSPTSNPENATPLNIMEEGGEAGVLMGFNKSSTARDEEIDEGVPGPWESMTHNGSVEDAPVQELTGLEFIDEDELVEAPTGVRALGDGFWGYCALVTITNHGDRLEDYQVRIEVPSSHLPILGLIDWWRVEDIRFTDSNGVLLPHWYDRHAGSDHAVFWVRVPAIPSGDSIIYLHYGNLFAQSASNGTATFLFYDDFEDDQINSAPDNWSGSGKINARVRWFGSSKSLYVKGTSNEQEGYLVADHGPWSNVSVRERVLFGSSCCAGVTGRFVDTENYLSAPAIENGSGYFARIAGNCGGNIWNSSDVWEFERGFFQDWYVEELGLSEQRADLFIDGDYLGSADLPSDAPSSGKSGLFIIGKNKDQYRDEHIVRRYSPVYGESHYLPDGTILSDVFDTGAEGSEWDTFAWDTALPLVTKIEFAVRASNFSFEPEDANPEWTPVGDTSPVSTSLPSGRYLQWRATLSTVDETQTPVLEEVRVWYTPGGY